jgi:hypothetical protein
MIQALVKIADCALILLYFHDKQRHIQRHIPKKIKFLENNHSIKKEFSENVIIFFAFPIFLLQISITDIRISQKYILSIKKTPKSYYFKISNDLIKNQT